MISVCLTLVFVIYNRLMASYMVRESVIEGLNQLDPATRALDYACKNFSTKKFLLSRGRFGLFPMA